MNKRIRNFFPMGQSLTRQAGCRVLALMLATMFCMVGCSQGSVVEGEHKELLIYCGITMIDPMSEIARIIEQEQNSKISLIKGGSGNLLKAIQTNGVGDLYLPGSDSYIAEAQKLGLVADKRHVGFNKAAMMVVHGNPKNIPHDLNVLASRDYYAVIGNPDSGSIGRETKKILNRAGIYQAVQANAREMTTDSKRLTQVLKNAEADVVINWFATSTWSDNRDFIEVLPIDERLAQKKRLVLAVLNSSRHPEVARRFMEYAASAQGRDIFNRYGLYDVK